MTEIIADKLVAFRPTCVDLLEGGKIRELHSHEMPCWLFSVVRANAHVPYMCIRACLSSMSIIYAKIGFMSLERGCA